MAVRLNVIMVHGAPQTAKAQRVAQSVVGELIGLAGIDLTLVDRLSEIQPTSTDYLTLDSITGDVAVLDWQPQDSTVDDLSAVGFVGSRARHGHDLEVVHASKTRRIYAFNLCEFDDGQDVIAALRELLSSRQVKTISLDSLLPSQARERPQPANSSVSPVSARAKSSASAPILPTPSAATVPQSKSEPQSSPGKTLDLDALVDQLDMLDQ